MEMDLSQSSIGFETQQECRLKTVNFQHIAACISYIMETVEVCATESAMKKLERWVSTVYSKLMSCAIDKNSISNNL